jgi:uncharacterized protein
MTRQFTWDETKRRLNLQKHGVDFVRAAAVFADPAAVHDEDRTERYDEVRFRVIGVASETLLAVIYTERGDLTRIISARNATKREKRIYAASQDYQS